MTTENWQIFQSKDNHHEESSVKQSFLMSLTYTTAPAYTVVAKIASTHIWRRYQNISTYLTLQSKQVKRTPQDSINELII